MEALLLKEAIEPWGSTPGGGEVTVVRKAPKPRRVTARKPRAKRPPLASVPLPVPEPSLRPPPPPAFVPPAPSALVATAKSSFQLARALASSALSRVRVAPALQAAVSLGTVVKTSLGLGRPGELDEYGQDADVVAKLQPLLDFLYDTYWRVSVLGAHNVPVGGAVLVGNHCGAVPVEGPVVQRALTRERSDLPLARWLAEDEVLHAPLFGTLVNRLGAVRASTDNALRLLGDRRPVIVFPEGVHGIGKPFHQRYQLQRLGRGGFAKLAVRAGVPIVPVAIVGGEEALPLLGKVPARLLGLGYLPVTLPPLPTKWTLRFGEPIWTRDLDPESSEDPSVIDPLVERTRFSLEHMLESLLGQRRSIFRG